MLREDRGLWSLGRGCRILNPLGRPSGGEERLITALRRAFNRDFNQERYAAMQALVEERAGTRIGFRLAETPVFVRRAVLESMAASGAAMAHGLIADAAHLSAARRAIPAGYQVAGETGHPNFLTADFALVEGPDGDLVPRLVELQAFPSLYGFQEAFAQAYRAAFALPKGLGVYLGGLDETSYWELLARTVVGHHDPEHVALVEVDPLHQKTLPDFLITARRLGIALVDIGSIEVAGDKLHYRDAAGRLVRIERIYNRAIADELIARNIRLPFDWTRRWDVEWAGHPNWYFLISKFSVPWLSREAGRWPEVPPGVFLDEFLEGRGRAALAAMGVPMPADCGPETVFDELLLKPLFSFAGKGIVFAPTQALLESIPRPDWSNYLLQQRMRFVPTVETPQGWTQPEFRILYLWPDGGQLTPALSLVRLGRGKMMGVDHNRDQAWVGASAAFYPSEEASAE